MLEIELVGRILEGSGELCRRLGIQFQAELPAGNVTVPQLRVMLHLYTNGPGGMMVMPPVIVWLDGRGGSPRRHGKK